MADFEFLYPLWFLALLPMAYLLRKRKKQAIVSSLIAPHLLQQLQQGRQTQRSFARKLLAICWLLAVIALAGPSWEKNSIPGFQLAGARVLVMDMSHSMYTSDVQPNRLSQAKFKALDLLPGWVDGSTGLVAYSRDGYLISPLTEDSKTLAALIPALSPDIMPFSGSNAAKGIEEAIALIKQAGFKEADIILVTDGISDKELDDALDVLDDRAIRVSALAVGTAEGGPVRHADGSIYLQETRTVISRMQVRNLKTLAANTGGIVRSFSATNQDVNAIIGLTKVPIAAYKDKRQQDLDQKVNAGFWLLIPLLCFAALAYRKGITLFTLPILIILQYSPLPAYAERPEKASKDTISMYFDNSDQRGYRYFEAGDYETAALSFSDPVWKAIALYRSGRFHAAVSVLEPLSDKSTRYNLANAYVRIGDIDRAITSYKEALEFNPQHEAAAHNLNLLLDVLGRSSEKVSINPKSEQQLRQEQKKQAAPRSTRSKDDKTRGKNRELASEQEGNKQDQSNRNQSQKNQSSDQSKTKQNDKGKKNNDTNRTQAKRPAPKAGGSQSGAISDPVIKKLEQIPDQPERLLRAQMLLQSQKRDLPEVTENTW